MHNIHPVVHHGRLAKRVHSAVYESCQNESPLLSGLLSLAGYELRDLRRSVYQGADAVNRHIRDELRHV